MLVSNNLQQNSQKTSTFTTSEIYVGPGQFFRLGVTSFPYKPNMSCWLKCENDTCEVQSSYLKLYTSPLDLSAKLIYLKTIEVSPAEKPESTDTRLCGHKLRQPYLYQISPLHFKKISIFFKDLLIVGTMSGQALTVEN